MTDKTSGVLLANKVADILFEIGIKRSGLRYVWNKGKDNPHFQERLKELMLEDELKRENIYGQNKTLGQEIVGEVSKKGS